MVNIHYQAIMGGHFPLQNWFQQLMVGLVLTGQKVMAEKIYGSDKCFL